MNFQRFRTILTLVGILMVAGWCYFFVMQGDQTEPESFATLEPTQTFGPTPTPALVGMDSVCQAQGEVRVEGYLHIPDSIGCERSGSSKHCSVWLVDLITRTRLLISLPVEGEREAPVPNHMLNLPASYDTGDFMVATTDSRWVGEGSIVRVTGLTDPIGYTNKQGYSCNLAYVRQVEKLERFTGIEGIAREATLRAALKEGWVEVTITGDGLTRIDLKIEPKVNFNLNLEIEAGTIFASDSSGVQNMVVRRETFVFLKPEIEAEVELEVSCAQMQKHEPNRGNTFTVLPDLAPEDLIMLLEWAEFAFEPLRIQQFSVWTITDNPRANGYVELTVGVSTKSSGPDPEELARIRELFLLAGLDISKYRALKEQ